MFNLSVKICGGDGPLCLFGSDIHGFCHGGRLNAGARKPPNARLPVDCLCRTAHSQYLNKATTSKQIYLKSVSLLVFTDFHIVNVYKTRVSTNIKDHSGFSSFTFCSLEPATVLFSKAVSPKVRK